MFLSVTLNFHTSDDVIGMPVGNTAQCSFIVSLGSADLISSTNEVWRSKKLNSAYEVYPNLNFGQ